MKLPQPIKCCGCDMVIGATFNQTDNSEPVFCYYCLSLLSAYFLTLSSKYNYFNDHVNRIFNHDYSITRQSMTARGNLTIGMMEEGFIDQ